MCVDKDQGREFCLDMIQDTPGTRVLLGHDPRHKTPRLSTNIDNDGDHPSGYKLGEDMVFILRLCKVSMYNTRQGFHPTLQGSPTRTNKVFPRGFLF